MKELFARLTLRPVTTASPPTQTNLINKSIPSLLGSQPSYARSSGALECCSFINGRHQTLMVEDKMPCVRIRVLLADDHPLVVERAREILAPEFEVVGEVHDGSALVKAAGELDPDVVVVDITMPILNGLEAARCLRAGGSRAKIVFLTVHEDPDFVREALAIGASGYVAKATMASDLIPAILTAVEGQKFISTRIPESNVG